MDTSLLLASVTKWEDMGCTPGTTPKYLLLLRLHKTQKPCVSQGLYPILLLALLAVVISTYTRQGFILCGTVSYGTVSKTIRVSVYFLTQAMMKADTSLPKKLIFSPIKGRLPLTPPPCWSHVKIRWIFVVRARPRSHVPHWIQGLIQRLWHGDHDEWLRLGFSYSN